MNSNATRSVLLAFNILTFTIAGIVVAVALAPFWADTAWLRFAAPIGAALALGALRTAQATILRALTKEEHSHRQRLAHDLRSPSQALKAVLYKMEDAAAPEYDLVRRAALRLDEIADSLAAGEQVPKIP